MVTVRIFTLLSAILLSGCFSPRYSNGQLQCSPEGNLCPAGYYCADDKTCWRNGEGPPAADGGAGDGGAGEDGGTGEDGGMDMQGPPLVYPPAAVWISSGGGSASVASGNAYGLSIGGADVLGKATASSGASASFGYFSSAAQ